MRGEDAAGIKDGARPNREWIQDPNRSRGIDVQDRIKTYPSPIITRSVECVLGERGDMLKEKIADWYSNRLGNCAPYHQQ